ncbi:RAMP superfamily CRISPR-associated protein [Pantanalinema rosaneae CENA516]|uniref:RAMP superfamily CRISPR-associated protein n=1 Tax=Pantanalinema rosaneae TaxID=1620701 RepID=UPI003D6FFA09
MIRLQDLPLNPITSYQLTAVINSALCVGAGGSSGSLADKPIIRTAKNELVIPASQLKGRLRHECEKLARGLGWSICNSPNPQTMCPQRTGLSEQEKHRFHRNAYWITANQQHHCLICQIFGNPVLPSKVLFDDLICTQDPDSVAEVLRPGVTLNRMRRTAENQKLFFLETSPANAQLPFVGHIHVPTDFPEWAKALMLAGLKHIHALGGSKSAGLGWLHWDDCSDWQIDPSAWEFLAQGAAQ